MNISRTLFRYQTQPDANIALTKRLQELAREWPRAGHPKLHALIRREGVVVNHKRTERLYALLKLSLRQKHRKRKRSSLRLVLPTPTYRNERWSMDFMSDSLASGRPLRLLTIVDQFTRESPWIEVNRSLTSKAVVRVLEQLASSYGLPKAITVDNGPEFTSRVMGEWCDKNEVQLHFIKPGKPIENAFIESFNARVRDECLNQNLFMNIDDARLRIEAWRNQYNQRRPHGSLNQLTPAEFAAIHGKNMVTA